MKQPKTAELASMKQLKKAESEFQLAVNKQGEIEKKALAKLKNKGKKKDDKKGNHEEDEESETKVPGDPYLLGQLNELIRSEKFESRMQDMQEVD